MNMVMLLISFHETDTSGIVPPGICLDMSDRSVKSF